MSDSKDEMKQAGNTLTTPIYLKTDPDAPCSDDDSVFYLLTASGLFMCRNHAFFRSCVPAHHWPSELAPHHERLDLDRHPKIPAEKFERIVGFFAAVATRHGAEAAALIVWNETTREVDFHIPDQQASVVHSRWGGSYACDVRYTVPALPAHLRVIGDVHSHADGSAYASAMDQLDESYRPGLHIVVGRIFQEPPEFHCEFVVDGIRFPLDTSEVLEDYTSRRVDVPEAWHAKLEIETTDHRPWPSQGAAWSGPVGSEH